MMQSLGKGVCKLAGVRIALGTFAAVADDIEHIALAIAHAGDETTPVAMLIPGQQAGVVTLAIVEVTDHMHGPRMRRPSAERCAVGD